jgi:hypothetical protein
VVQARLPQVVGWRAIKLESHSRNAIDRGDREAPVLRVPAMIRLANALSLVLAAISPASAILASRNRACRRSLWTEVS